MLSSVASVLLHSIVILTVLYPLIVTAVVPTTRSSSLGASVKLINRDQLLYTCSVTLVSRIKLLIKARCMLLSNIANNTVRGVTSYVATSSSVAISLVTIHPIRTCFPASSSNVNSFVLANFKA